MFKLVLSLFFISLSFAKITKDQFDLFAKYDRTLTEITKKVERKIDLKSNETLWVLNLNDDSLDFKRLYLARKAEDKVYKNIIVPEIENYKLQHLVGENKDDRINEEPVNDIDNENFKKNYNISEIKKQILIVLNKFFTNQLNDPVSYLSDIPEKKTLKLFFTGPYTSLIVTSEEMMYHYFITPPSPFPNWFYGEHKNIMNNENGNYVDIPTEVQQDFLVKLLNVIKIHIYEFAFVKF